MQDVLCHHQHCEAAYRCWHRYIATCCWPPQSNDECHIPGLPLGWTRPGGDPAGVSNNEALGTA